MKKTIILEPRTISRTIEIYLSDVIKDEFHRYKSWDNCYQAFNTINYNENLPLELAFYLASWGMYRGSSGLLQKNHLIHKEAVSILFSEKCLKLKCSLYNEVTKKNIEEILEVKNKLATYYRSCNFSKGKDDYRPISPTDTLMSKIMLGTLGCVPAYDRYFIGGLKEIGMSHFNFNSTSLSELFDFIDDNKFEIENAQQLIKNKTKCHYPIMKILDMFFWQIGYDKDLKNGN